MRRRRSDGDEDPRRGEQVGVAALLLLGVLNTFAPTIPALLAAVILAFPGSATGLLLVALVLVDITLSMMLAVALLG